MWQVSKVKCWNIIVFVWGYFSGWVFWSVSGDWQRAKPAALCLEHKIMCPLRWKQKSATRKGKRQLTFKRHRKAKKTESIKHCIWDKWASLESSNFLVGEAHAQANARALKNKYKNIWNCFVGQLKSEDCMNMNFFFPLPYFSKATAVRWTGTAGMTGMWDNKWTWFPLGSSESEQRRGRNIACQSCDRASLHSRISLPQSLSLKCLLHWASGRNRSKMTAVRSKLTESGADPHAATPEPSTWS